MLERNHRRAPETVHGQFAEQGKLPKYAVPTGFGLVDAISKTSVGKLDKKVLRKSHSEQRAD